jgi:hypothetical protein
MSYEQQVSEVLREFAIVINSIAGVCFDAIRGFDHNLKEMDRFQQRLISESSSNEPQDVQLQHLDNAWILYGRGDPNDPNSVVHHQTTRREFKIRNSHDGSNRIFIGNMGLIAIYQYWEDVYRQRIADVFKVQKDNVQCDIFGDLRIIRHSILHHKGVALPEIARCKELQWFKPKDQIVIDTSRFSGLLEKLWKLKITVRE